MECLSGRIEEEVAVTDFELLFLDVAKEAMKISRYDTQLVGKDSDGAPTHEKQGKALLCKVRIQKL
jgi:hypothetical protein